MALNQNHTENGNVLINNEEITLRMSKNIELVFSDITCSTDLLKGIKKGNVYLTPYRLVFVSSNTNDCLGSAMFPYCHLTCCSIEQPVFAANCINGTVAAEPSGGWEGKARFKMAFLRGGALEFGQHLLKLAANAYGALPNQINFGSHDYPSPRPTSTSHGQTDDATSEQTGLNLSFCPMADSAIQSHLPLPAVACTTAPPTTTPPPPYPGQYNPNNPYIYLPMEPPPCYTPFPESRNKRN